MKLAELVKAWRCFNDMSFRETADQIGIQEKVLRHFERSGEASGATLAIILQWALDYPQ